MKLSKTGWFIIAIGLFLIALAGLGAVRSQQVHQQNQLNEKLSTAKLKLNGFQFEPLAQQKDELKWRLDQTLAQSEAARTMLSQPIGSIAINDILFRLAEDYRVTVAQVTSSGLAEEKLAGINCSVLPLTTIVTGNLTDIVGFITTLSGDLTADVIRSVEISLPDMTSDNASASIELAVYSYQGG